MTQTTQKCIGKVLETAKATGIEIRNRGAGLSKRKGFQTKKRNGLSDWIGKRTFCETGKDFKIQINRLVNETGGGVTVMDAGKKNG